MQFCVRKFVAGLSDDISPPSHSPSRWLLSIKPTGTLICGVLIQKVISENVLVVPVLAPPVRHQAITWNYDDSFSIGPFGTNFNEIWFKIRKLSLKKMYSKMWSAMCLLGDNELRVHPGCIRNTILVTTSSADVPGILTHWGQSKMTAVFQTTFSNAFSWMKIVPFWWKFHWNLLPMVQSKIIIGSDNGLVPVRRQAIIWTNESLS